MKILNEESGKKLLIDLYCKIINSSLKENDLKLYFQLREKYGKPSFSLSESKSSESKSSDDKFRYVINVKFEK